MSNSENDEVMQGEDSSNQGGFVSALDLPDVPSTKLPPHLELRRTRVLCNVDAPDNTDTIQYSGAYSSMGIDNSLRSDEFCNNFKVMVNRLTNDEMEFDMVGVDPSLANAFRRILLSEKWVETHRNRVKSLNFVRESFFEYVFSLPTMAIEKVFIANNTSVIQDEVLAHRLGLIPIIVDPRHFDYLSENDRPNEKNTIVFKLHVRCQKGESRRTVKSDELWWLPKGSQFLKESGNPASNTKPETYTSFNLSQDLMPAFSNNPINVYPGIIVAKLAPGQEIELEAHAVKGMGKTHAKWSPVATCWYRMLPEVVLNEDIKGEMAEELVKKCPATVFDIEELANGKKRASVARPRACTLCRECIKDGEEWERRISLHRVKDHFIFTIESVGALPPEVLFTEAVKILEDKCERVISDLS